jgi:hypothetical protein
MRVLKGKFPVCRLNAGAFFPMWPWQPSQS